jgi:hypothetical protein
MYFQYLLCKIPGEIPVEFSSPTPYLGLNLLHRDNKWRQKLLLIVETALFDRFILLLILANSVCMMLTDHRNPMAARNGVSKKSSVCMI